MRNASRQGGGNEQQSKKKKKKKGTGTQTTSGKKCAEGE